MELEDREQIRCVFALESQLAGKPTTLRNCPALRRISHHCITQKALHQHDRSKKIQSPRVVLVFHVCHEVSRSQTRGWLALCLYKSRCQAPLALAVQRMHVHWSCGDHPQSMENNQRSTQPLATRPRVEIGDSPYPTPPELESGGWSCTSLKTIGPQHTLRSACGKAGASSWLAWGTPPAGGCPTASLPTSWHNGFIFQRREGLPAAHSR